MKKKIEDYFKFDGRDLHGVELNITEMRVTKLALTSWRGVVYTEDYHFMTYGPNEFEACSLLEVGKLYVFVFAPKRHEILCIFDIVANEQNI